MKKIAVVLLSVFAFVAVAAIAMADQGAAVIMIDKIQAKFPPVTFNHAEHQKRNSDCTVCHHKTKKGETPKACSECHGKVEGAPSFKDAMHNKCKACHKTEQAAGKKAPTKCPECHVKK